MRSDETYERLIKLWISLWSLVLENKRHLETVTAVLQRIVFENHRYPDFKNWKEICRVGDTNVLMMQMLMIVDLSTRDRTTEQIIAAFPECFSYEEVSGPYPLSLIRKHAYEANRNQGFSETAADLPVSFNDSGLRNLNIPIIGYDKFGSNISEMDAPRLPEGIDPNILQGSIIELHGKRFVVLENNDLDEEIWVTPAECVRADL